MSTPFFEIFKSYFFNGRPGELHHSKVMKSTKGGRTRKTSLKSCGSGTRTHDLQLMRLTSFQLLYPANLPNRNRTYVFRLKICCVPVTLGSRILARLTNPFPEPVDISTGCGVNRLVHIYIPQSQTPCGGGTLSSRAYPPVLGASPRSALLPSPCN